MTEKSTANPKTQNRCLNIPIIFFIITTCTIILNAEVVRSSIINGIRLSALSIIPSLFPFFIMSDFLSANYQDNGGAFSKFICNALGISRISIGSIVIGFVCGFPLGVKNASELYLNKRISKEECERLCMISNNPSFAFVVSGVGAALFGSIAFGLLLYFSVVLSAAFIATFTKPNKQKNQNIANIPRQKFELSLSIKSAAISSIYISSYIIFFSAVLGLVFHLCKIEWLNIIFASVLEIGNATAIISRSKIIPVILRPALAAFSLGFSGISVFMQSASYLPPEISKRKLLGYKLIQGALSAFLATILYYIIIFFRLITFK